MKIHEYQAKELFRQFGIPVPDGELALTPQQAEAAARRLNRFPVALKAQVHAGGRGKAGGVKLAHSAEEAFQRAEEIIGMRLVSHQTGPEGKEVKKVLVEQGVEIERELYLSLIPDRSQAQVLVMASSVGGVDIETVAEDTPEKIIRILVNPLTGIQPYHCREVAFSLDLKPALIKPFINLIQRLYHFFVTSDCALLEINPLVATAQNTLLALDAKVTFDDNALFRHPELTPYNDEDEIDPLEVEAAKYHLNYIKLDGDVGNMVNGAGLAMATMDIIQLAGARPANFLDVGGGASAEMVENGFRIIQSDQNVKGILVNIFGGILRCDVLAKGIVQAAQKVGLTVPVVIRMEGTNVEEGRQILNRSGLKLITAVDLKDAVQRVAEIVTV